MMKLNAKKRDMRKLAQYRNNLLEHPRLTYLFLELTDACNLACLHCGSNACPQNKTYLPFEDIKEVLNQVAAAYSPKSIMVCLSGGEPFLHPDFFRIAKHAKNCGFSCGVTTNGTLIDRNVSEKIVNSGIDSVTFSLDGLEDTHDWFRNKSGAFQRAVLEIKNLQKVASNSVATQITSVIHRKNIHQLDALYELVCQLGVASWRVINLEPIGRALDNQDLLLDGEQLKTLFSFIRKTRYSSQVSLDVTYGCSHYLTEEFERTVRDHYFICGSGIYVASILCNGDIYSCMDIERRPELVQGNIHTDRFVDVWENRFQVFRSDRSETNAICRTCSDREYCRGDSAHTWDYHAKRPLLCVKQLFAEKEYDYGVQT